jgi:amino acid transporter
MASRDFERNTSVERVMEEPVEPSKGLRRTLDWTGAFWVAAGVPPLVLFSLGGIAGVAGKTGFLVWVLSMCMGFSQSFTYAEMAGMFRNKSGGASVYGAIAWLRYSKFIAPLSVWCNWFAWSPVLSLGCSIAANYILNLACPDQSCHGLRTWEAFSVAIPGLGELNFNTVFLIGTALMSVMICIQHFGIALTAYLQRLLAVIVLVPLLVVAILPIFTGSIVTEHFEDIVPPIDNGSDTDGSWDLYGFSLFLGSLYMAAWTTYAFETAVCYTSELKDPKKDSVKAIVCAGLVCFVFFTLIPFSFQGVLSREELLAPSIADGTGIAEALARMAGGNTAVTMIFEILMILGLFLAIMTAMAGSSRTLYQGSKDGWLPKFLSSVNSNGAPAGAMWTDFTFNLFLLALASDSDGYYKVMAISNVGYILFNFLNLNAGWIHRVDSADLERPWKAPTALIGFNTFLAFVNAVILGAGAKVWGYSYALWLGLAFAALIIPVFAYRHYYEDGGQFPAEAKLDMGLEDGSLGERKAGVLPYCALAFGAAVVVSANYIFVLPS